MENPVRDDRSKVRRELTAEDIIRNVLEGGALR